MTNNLKTSFYRPDIDGLRALAVLSVVLFHFFPEALTGGYVGVDIFFVISGFLITRGIVQQIQLGDFSFIDFYSRRARRIFPSLIVILLFSLGVGALVFFTDEYQSLGRHVFSGAFFISNLTLWYEIGYFDVLAEFKPLLHLWSLGIEEQFYILWPIFLLLAYKLKISLKPFTLALFFLSLMFCSFSLHSSHSFGFYNPLARFWELLAGAYLGQLSLDRKKLVPDSWSQPLSYLSLSLLILPLFLLDKKSAFPGYWALLPVLGAVTLIASENSRLNQSLFSKPFMVFFGKISYPLYLWHWIFLAYANVIRSSAPPNMGYRLSIILPMIGLSWLTYRYVETPLRKNRRAALPLTLTLFAIGFFGLWVDFNEGLPRRPIAIIQSKNDFNFPPEFRHECLIDHSPSSDWCNDGNISGEINKAEVVLVGDSFATSFSKMLEPMAKDDKFSYFQYGKGQCPILLNFGPEYCRHGSRAFFEKLAESPKVQTLIFASNWAAYTEGKDFHWVNYQSTPEEFKEAFSKTLSHVLNMGKRVVLILEPPVGTQPKKCLRYKALGLKSTCDVSLAERTPAINKKNSILNDLLKLSPEVKTFDPVSYFCEQGVCQVYHEEESLYIDSSHLSAHGAHYLYRKARSELAELIFNPQEQR
jgi:peptidoglycan/LPS O-acetylase OafA/YrhL